MTAETLPYLLAGAVMGGFVNGLAGFGTALFALGWWLQVYPPTQAVAMVLAVSVVSGVQGVVAVRDGVRWDRLLRFLLPGLLLGVPIGLHLLELIEAGPLKALIAGFMLLYGAFFLFRRDLPKLSRPYRAMDAGLGFAGGVLGAMAGLSGALPTMWVALRGWPKAEARAVLQPYNLVILSVSAALLAWAGAYDEETLIALAVALPVAVISAQLGIVSFRRLTDGQFQRLLILLMTISGAVLAVQELL